MGLLARIGFGILYGGEGGVVGGISGVIAGCIYAIHTGQSPMDAQQTILLSMEGGAAAGGLVGIIGSQSRGIISDYDSIGTSGISSNDGVGSSTGGVGDDSAQPFSGFGR